MNKVESWQRGDIDCRGLDFMIIKYGKFYQLIRGIVSGYISICIDKSYNLIRLEDGINKILTRELI